MRSQRRYAFTLVEMLVSMALVLFIMVLLSQAFTAGLQTFRVLKAIGDMEERLRTTTNILRSDLTSFQWVDSAGVAHPLSSLSLSGTSINGPPAQGFFRIFQGSPSQPDGPGPTIPVDGDGIPSTIATNHVLHFTVLRTGNQRQSFFSADVSKDPAAYTAGTGWVWLPPAPLAPPQYQDVGTYTSQWAEVAYFLRPNGTNANGQSLFTLYRRQRLLWPPSQVQPTPVVPSANLTQQVPTYTAPAYVEISCETDPTAPANIHFNSPADVTVPQRRFSMAPGIVTPTPTIPGYTAPYDGGIPYQSSGQVDTTNGSYSILADPTLLATGTSAYLYPQLAGADAMVTDVISFDVQILPASAATGGFVDVPASTTNPLFSSATGWHCFDTWAGAPAPAVPDPYYANYWTGTGGGWQSSGNNYSCPNPAITILALRISIRVWDRNSQLARQVTLVQNM